jgi:Protein of unknown function (DUF3298).
MNEFQSAKLEYESPEIPRELESRVRAGIAEGKRRAGRRRVTVRTFTAIAACFAVLFAGLNLFPTFAAAAAEVPVVGQVFRVLTVRSWHQSDGDATYDVSQPAVSGGGDFAEKINQEIQKRVDEKVAEGNQAIQEYKEAFLSTGGTEAEWAQHDNKVSVTYSIKSQTDTTVSFVIDSNVSIADAYQEEYYYNLDVADDQELTLKDLLGDDWVNVCNTSIKQQIAGSKDPSVFFDASMGGFTTVDENTGFYINAAGNPVVVFPRTTIAIGAMGQVEFEIKK